MKIITDEPPASAVEALWAYNGRDCMLTYEILEVLLPQLSSETSATYTLSGALQAPVLEMNMRGILIDQRRRNETIKAFEKDIEYVKGNLECIIQEGLGLTINWRSNQQLQFLFYEVLGIKPILKRSGDGTYRPSVDRGSLEKLQLHFYALPIVNHILLLRDIQMKIDMLKTGIDPDGRIRTSFNIAGTNTGRFSSSNSDFNTGRNLQNIDERLRSVFISDSGYKFANIDLEQADSRNIGALILKHLGDPTYLDACDTGDLHTTVAEMVWPELEVDPRTSMFYRNESFRQAAKKMGHGTNYYGKPQGMAVITKYPARLIAGFQPRYFRAFPGIPAYHQFIRQTLRESGVLFNLHGRRRRFFGRRDDEATLRDAIAYTGQSSTADCLNQGLLNVWRSHLCQVLIQVHDSILVQYPEDREEEILPQVIGAMQVPLIIENRLFTIPCEAKIGWNWGPRSESNPDGLVKWNGPDVRTRTRPPAKVTSLFERTLEHSI
jgi:DNA polymerase I